MKILKILAVLFFAAFVMKGAIGMAGVAQICNQEVCQPITYFEQQQVLEKLTLMFKKNANQVLMCSADSVAKKFLNHPLTFSGQTNMMQVDFQVPFVRILQKERLENGLALALDYQIKANEKYPACSASISHFTLFPKGEIILTSPSFECQATELGKTLLAFQFKIDYINFETGWLGAFYEASTSGDVLGEGSGYVMMQVSSERSIQLKRRQPTYDENRTRFRSEMGRENSAQGKLTDWDWDHIREKWNNFKEKALKIIYLEPMDD